MTVVSGWSGSELESVGELEESGVIGSILYKTLVNSK